MAVDLAQIRRLAALPARPGDPGYNARMPKPAPDPPSAMQRVLSSMAPTPRTNPPEGIVAPNGTVLTPDAPPDMGWAAAPPQQRVVVSWGKDPDTVVVGIEVAPEWEMEDDPIVVPLQSLSDMMPIIRALSRVKNLTGTKLP